MRKIGFFLIPLACALVAATVYAEDTTNGYVMSIYGNSLKGAYGDCVHTAYYDADIDGRAECGDAHQVASAPVMVEKPKTIIETVMISDADNVLFNFNASSLTAAGTAAITEFGRKLGAQPDIKSVTIDGYTDAIGKNEYNLKLSTSRANAVKQFFIQNGVPAGIIVTHGYGEKNSNTSTACFAKYGNDHEGQIWQIEGKLSNKKYKSKDKHVVKEKKQLQEKLNALHEQRDKLLTCTAPDRRVIFTIEHNQQVKKTVMVKEPESSPVSIESLAKPPIDGGE